jgi:citrate lyase subunit beta/citryl-CoA lyase
VPGNSPEKLEKALRLGADCLILDLEDSVPEIDKSVARSNVKGTLESSAPDDPPLLVRINSLSSPHGPKDLKEIIAPALAAIVLPKCDSSDVVVKVDRIMRAEEESKGLTAGSISFVLLIESARALLEAAVMVQASPRVVAVALGAEDYCLDMGIMRTRNGDELAYPRATLAVIARAHGCLAIDAIFADFKDKEGLTSDALVARSMGFSGKLAIHPAQVGPIDSVFSPQEAEVETAKRILESARSAKIDGLGVMSLDGKMVDRPIVERARRLLAANEQLINKQNI